MRDLVSSLQFRLVMGFALTIALTLAATGIFISFATEMQTGRTGYNRSKRVEKGEETDGRGQTAIPTQ